jgi:chromosome segregation ATPase
MLEKNPRVVDDKTSSKYLQDQVEFLTQQIIKLQSDISDKDEIIKKVVMEKNQYAKQFNQLETQNNHLMETLSNIENEKEEVHRTNQSL